MSLYPDSDESQRATARQKVSQAAHEGRPPSTNFSAADLEWAFAGDEERLAELEQIAERKRREEIERDLAADRRRDVDFTAKQLLKKWAEDEERELRARAYAEAERIVSEREAAES